MMSNPPTVKDFFDAEWPFGDVVYCYKDWEWTLPGGYKLTGCVTKFIIVRNAGGGHYELYLGSQDPGRYAFIINVVRDAFLANPRSLLPESLRDMSIKMNLGGQALEYSQLPTSKTFTIYVEALLDRNVVDQSVARWAERGLELLIKDQSFVNTNRRLFRPYAFISHDSSDKATVARPLAERLSSEVGRVWYDEYSLQVGQSLRESIEDGLKHSDRCVLILSKAFLRNEGWARREFDSIYTREIVEKQKVILPVWVDVTKEELYQYSPILADRVATIWSTGIDDVVKRLASAIKQPPAR
jgi:hypothetical protein